MPPPWSKATSSSAPLPPLELADRVGAVSGSARSLEPFLAYGRAGRELLEQMLPGDWTWKDKRVLDFGCGAARILRHFLPEATEGQFVGCDIDAPSIGWLQENLCPPLEAFVNDEAPPLDQPDGAFDLVRFELNRARGIGFGASPPPSRSVLPREARAPRAGRAPRARCPCVTTCVSFTGRARSCASARRGRSALKRGSGLSVTPWRRAGAGASHARYAS